MKTVEENGLPGKLEAADSSAKVVEPAKEKNQQPERVDDAVQSPARAALKDNNRLLVVGAGAAILVLLLAFAVMGIMRNSASIQKGVVAAPRRTAEKLSNTSAPATSSVPLLDAGHPTPQEADASHATPESISQTAQRRPQSIKPTNLGEVKPFDASQPWQPPTFKPGIQPSDSTSDSLVSGHATAETKAEHDALDKPSLVFVKSNTASGHRGTEDASPALELGVGLPPGTRLRARLESAVNTAVRTPVVAVIEYNYERNGEIVVPAGAKALGHLEAADRSGYLGVRFDSLLMPDGSSVSIEAAATDLELRPLRGKVEGKNTGKNILVRSFAGVGEIASALVGRSSINQPLSESDLLRERVGNNIGQASDQTVANLAISEHIVVSVPAGTEFYVVMQKSAKPNLSTAQPKMSDRPESVSPSVEELRQLLQLEKELKAEPN